MSCRHTVPRKRGLGCLHSRGLYDGELAVLPISGGHLVRGRLLVKA